MRDLLLRLDAVGHAMAPAAVTLLFVLLGAVPTGLPAYPQIPPFFALMMVYFWAVHRPMLMPAPVVFAAGLLTDILSGAPLGLNALILLLAASLAAGQGRFLADRPFRGLWCGFAVTAAVAALLEWAASSLWNGVVLPIRPAGFRALAGIALFPVVAWLCLQIDRGLPRRATA